MKEKQEVVGIDWIWELMVALVVERVRNDACVSGFNHWKDGGHSLSGKKRGLWRRACGMRGARETPKRPLNDPVWSSWERSGLRAWMRTERKGLGDSIPGERSHKKRKHVQRSQE